jgi:hypothetical protein
VDEDIIEVARTIRPYLPDLVGAEAGAYDQEIAQLLAEARTGRDVSDQLFTVLTRSPAAHAWSARVLEDEQHRPPEIAPPRVRSYNFEQLAGAGEPVDAERYACPEGDYVWYRISVAVPVPACPTHKCPLAAAS